MKDMTTWSVGFKRFLEMGRKTGEIDLIIPVIQRNHINCDKR